MGNSVPRSLMSNCQRQDSFPKVPDHETVAGLFPPEMLSLNGGLFLPVAGSEQAVVHHARTLAIEWTRPLLRFLDPVSTGKN
ncbi:MAG: hypothetical protein BVN32_14100 [Proteobacteria bacterium ST_bin14]|nr:MAG: hypothetical protein BVN32_14100 [Proteobacteria bacterium ST_bin14]